ncbi:MAG TPA: hypothetical protein VK531_01405, partial [Gemmatimonadales bacterium]|nr:hypothetical protein [Gemmatimonadales bacterium]
MIERMIPLRLPPGVYRNGTRYEAKNRWYNASGLRWYEGILGPIGGWRNVISNVTSGTATAGGNSTLADTTQAWPVNAWAGRTISLISGTGSPATKTVVSNTATVITISGTWAVNPAAGTVYQISGVQLQVGTVTGDDVLRLVGRPRAAYGWRANDGVSHLAIGTHSRLWLYTDGMLENITPAGFPAFADSDGAVNGLFVGGNFGSGGFGSGYYGTGSGALTLVPPATWTLDNFGELLVASHTMDGRLLKASPGGGAATAVDATAPISNRAVVVTPEHFIVALGANGDARMVKWPDQESLTDWAITEANQANEFELPTKGRLVTGRRARRQTVLWTDVDVYAMTYVGGIDIYAFEQLGDNCGLVGPQACVVLGDRMFWMSYGKFFEYDGALHPIPCDVLDEVFGQLDQSQRAKVQAIPMTLFNEVWWTYPTKGRQTYENDKYVGYNFEEKHWIMGTLARAAGIDRGVYEYPVLLDDTGFLFEHEFGSVRTGMTVFGETGPLEIGDGDQLVRIQQ